MTHPVLLHVGDMAGQSRHWTQSHRKVSARGLSRPQLCGCWTGLSRPQLCGSWTGLSRPQLRGGVRSLWTNLYLKKNCRTIVFYVKGSGRGLELMGTYSRRSLFCGSGAAWSEENTPWKNGGVSGNREEFVLYQRRKSPVRMEEFLGGGRSSSCSKGENPLKERRSSWEEGGVGPAAKEITPWRMVEFLGRERSWSCRKGKYFLKEWRSSWVEGGDGPVAKENTP